MDRSLALVFTGFLVAGCSGGSDGFDGQSYERMVNKFGAPYKTTGQPQIAGLCTWILVGTKDSFRGGIPDEKNPPIGALWVRFDKNMVVEWGGKVGDSQLRQQGTTR